MKEECLFFRVYEPSKSNKYAMKVYILAELKTGYVVSSELYSGVSSTFLDTAKRLVGC